MHATASEATRAPREGCRDDDAALRHAKYDRLIAAAQALASRLEVEPDAWVGAEIVAALSECQAPAQASNT